jgi:hypothetical protein
MKLRSVTCQSPVQVSGITRTSFQAGDTYDIDLIMPSGMVLIVDKTRGQGTMLSPAEWRFARVADEEAKRPTKADKRDLLP